MPDTIHLCQAFFSQINPNLTLAFELSKEMLVILLSSYENISK